MAVVCLINRADREESRGELKASGKPFGISRQEVWDTWVKVKGNQGAPGADRVAQTVAAARLEQAVEPVFHPGSCGYRPGRCALDAVGICRERCWKYGWVIDLDIRKFSGSVPWDLIVRAVEHHTGHETRWVVLYVRRWLAAPLQHPDGTLQQRDRGTPQGSAISPVLASLFMHYAFDAWLAREPGAETPRATRPCHTRRPGLPGSGTAGNVSPK